MNSRNPLGSDMPEGVRFLGPVPGSVPAWDGSDHPSDDDIATCVGCGLCLPQCPTYRLTQEEPASPRGRIAAMRGVDEGRAQVDTTFMRITDLCLTCRACEAVCPSDVPFARMMENARAQTEPLRKNNPSRLRSLALDFALPRNRVLDAMAALTPVVKPLLPKRLKRLLPRMRIRNAFTSLPRVTEPPPGTTPRGTVALLSGCVQDRWFREVNEATIRVLARNGWRVTVPKGQVCCGALSAHHGHLDAARDMARTNVAAFDDADLLIVNAAGCSAHAKTYGELVNGELRALALARRTRDLMEFLAEHGIDPPKANPGDHRVAYHDACHALHAQGIKQQPRDLLDLVPGLTVVEIPDGDTCCGAAGLYNILQPEMSSELGERKAAAISSTGVTVIASANAGCSLQIAAHMKERGESPKVLHPVELLDRAYRAEDRA